MTSLECSNRIQKHMTLSLRSFQMEKSKFWLKMETWDSLLSKTQKLDWFTLIDRHINGTTQKLTLREILKWQEIWIKMSTFTMEIMTTVSVFPKTWCSWFTIERFTTTTRRSTLSTLTSIDSSQTTSQPKTSFWWSLTNEKFGTCIHQDLLKSFDCFLRCQSYVLRLQTRIVISILNK